MVLQELNQTALDEIKKRLVKTYNPDAIYILEPRGTESVDVGILVILTTAPLQDRFDLMAEGHKALIGVKIPKTILVYTKEEFEDYATDPSSLSFSIKNYGTCIYAKA